MRWAALTLSGLTLLGQDTYFKEPEAAPWKPSWEFSLRSEKLDLGPGKAPIERTQSRVRLRWELGDEGGPWSARFQTSHRLSSDGNRTSLARFDNEPANGSQLDVAEVRLRRLRPTSALEAQVGLVENTLLTTEALWDPDLRLIGGTSRAFWRAEAAGIEELGLRVQAGEVRLPEGGRVTLRAAQAVLRWSLPEGYPPLEVKAFAGPWSLEARPEDALRFRRQNPAGPGGAYAHPHFRLDIVGLGLASTMAFPFEVLGWRQSNRDTGERGEEFQGWLGPRNRVWWPRLGYIRQRLAPSGALASVNGDLWWLHAAGDGQRYLASLTLPFRWELTLSHVDQTRREGVPTFRRSSVELKRRF